MRNGRAVDRDNPSGSMGVKARNHDPDPIRGSHQGQRHLPHKQAGHMTCTRPHAPRQIPLAIGASSTHDPGLPSTVTLVMPLHRTVCLAATGEAGNVR